MTAQQIAWAKQHDWFVRDNGDGTINVVDRWLDANDRSYHEDYMTWSGSFRQLRDWAGY